MSERVELWITQSGSLGRAANWKTGRLADWEIVGRFADWQTDDYVVRDEVGAAYERSVEEDARDGRFELYKTTAEHDGEEGRSQHEYPSQEELAG